MPDKFGKLRDIRDLLWACPCGYQGPYYKVMGHQGRLRRIEPEKHGDAFPLTDPLSSTVQAPSSEILGIPSPEPEPGLEKNQPWLSDGEEDPREQMAARLWAERFGGNGEPPPTGGGITLPPGEYEIERPSGPPQVTRDRVTVTLPMKYFVIYDWMRKQGWSQGQGGFDDFVEDMVGDHLSVCLLLELTVVPLYELSPGVYSSNDGSGR